ncbi:MAG: HAD family hydrolase [Chthoniobacterales bacterium]
MKKLLLFDIDGTLVDTGGAGQVSLRTALHTAFNTSKGLDKIVLDGATDLGIARELLSQNALPQTDENVSKLLDAYLVVLQKQLPKRQGRLLPGVQPLLQSLQKHSPEKCLIALLTGNIARGAKLKLSHYSIWDFFSFGSFADKHQNRNDLGPQAQQLAFEKTGKHFAPADIFVIGDTPRDIECGKAIGAITVAVATGNYSQETLAKHNPDLLFPDFSNTTTVIKALLG